MCASFPTISDSISESRESFRITLTDTSDSRVTIGEPSSTVVEIVDNTGRWSLLVFSLLSFGVPFIEEHLLYKQSSVGRSLEPPTTLPFCSHFDRVSFVFLQLYSYPLQVRVSRCQKMLGLLRSASDSVHHSLTPSPCLSPSTILQLPPLVYKTHMLIQ